MPFIQSATNKLFLLILVTGLAGCTTITESIASPRKGPDLSLEAMSPVAGPLDVGLAGEEPANIARYLMARGASGARISPDGSQVAFRYSITGEPQLWTVSANGGAPQQITFGNGITFFRWLPDSQGLIYGADNDGNEQETYFKVSASGKNEAEVLAAVEDGFRVFGDISSDGTHIIYASTERNGLDFDIYRADLSTGESQRLYEGTFGYFAQALSPDGTKAIVTETVGEDSDNLYLLDLSTGELTTVSKPDPRGNHGDPGFAWSPDSHGFYYSSNVGREYAAIRYYDLRQRRSSDVMSEARDIDEIELCGSAGNYIAYTENIDGFDTLYVRRLADSSRLEAPELPEGTYSLSCVAGTNDLVITVNGWATPGDVYLWDLDSTTMTKVFASDYAGLDPERFVKPESIRMAGRDGVELQGMLFLPRNADTPPPVVFEVHGGPTAQSRATFDPLAQYHVNRGIAVFKPNVRGSTGFGRTYATLDDKEKRRDSVRDLIDMSEYLRRDGRIDMDRAAVSGGSYGGYMVNAVLALYPDSFAAGVSRYGVADWVTALQIASPALKASDIIEYGDIREQEWIDFYTENSPIQLAGQIKVPVLYSHGVMDPRIDIYETELMVKTLRKNGIEAPYIRIAD